MNMRNFAAAAAIGLSLASIAGFAGAQQIYKWKDANGVTHFSQTPPSSGTHYSKMKLTSEPDISSNPAPAAATSSSEPGSSDAPRQSAPASSTQPDTASNRATLCKQLSSNISLLQSKQPVVTGGADGKQQVMSDNAREAQLATARAQQAQYCSSGGA
ncbi:MAG: hypothetical protein OJF61_000055 [Rhodanobacteraceae bacterium]|jgi:hypothetical protein|nr:MAG: hypothetical protein OJF61_000055 [Rhodanobacteraceae bacterium]